MSDVQLAALFGATLGGAIFGGLLGYARAHKEKPETEFDFADLILITYAGFIEAAGYMGVAAWTDSPFNLLTVIGAVTTGVGLTYTAKKTILP